MYLVTGGMGYVGAHVLVELLENEVKVVSVSRQNSQLLSGVEAVTGKKVIHHFLDLNDAKQVEELFKKYRFKGVIHLAASKTIPDSVKQPLQYYKNNIFSLIHLLQNVKKYQIPNFIFASSGVVYGNVNELPITENTPLGEVQSPYANTKRVGEQILKDFAQANPFFKCITLRYFNPIGAHPSAKIGELPTTIPQNLLPILTEVATGKREKLYVWGNDYNTRDGSCIRDYIHVVDVARAFYFSVKFLTKKESSCYEIINLGSKKGTTVLEMIKTFEKITSQKLKYEIAGKRKGDIEAIYADNKKAEKLLKWSPIFSLEDMIKTAWRWNDS